MSEFGPEIRPAATIMLVRDGSDGLEVFMVQRHHQIDFAKGALVFPGGKVDPADADPRLRARCDGLDGLDEAAAVSRVAGIRETFEECGVLLARSEAGGALVEADRLRDIEAKHRAALCAGDISMADVAAAESLRLAGDLLVPFAHWITPKAMPKRFDTWFFVVAAPPDQLALHDGGETVDSVWTTVDAAVQAEASGARTIVFPTLTNLRKLGRSRSVEGAVGAAIASRIVTVEPWVEKDEGGEPTLCIPEEADYDLVRIPLSGLR